MIATQNEAKEEISSCKNSQAGCVRKLLNDMKSKLWVKEIVRMSQGIRENVGRI